MINFFLLWAIDYILVMFAMCTDNIFWISASPEYFKIDDAQWPIKVEGKFYSNLADYVFNYRIKSVLTNWRDIVPAVITSFILSIVLVLLL